MLPVATVLLFAANEIASLYLASSRIGEVLLAPGGWSEATIIGAGLALIVRVIAVFGIPVLTALFFTETIFRILDWRKTLRSRRR